MGSILQYLSQKRQYAYQVCLCYAENYLMKKARTGREREFAEAKKEWEALGELIALAESAGDCR